MVETHGVDPVRLHMLYKAPPSEVLEWDDTSIVGMQRWLAKVHKLASAVTPSSDAVLPALEKMTKIERDVYREANATIKQVTEAMSTTYSFNTAIADLIKLSNFVSASGLEPSSPVYRHAVGSLVTMMSPVAPIVGEECWEVFSGSKQSVFQQAWPTWEEKALEKDTVTCVIQVNTRGDRVQLGSDALF